jgi:Tfp pilus assembly protein PilV
MVINYKQAARKMNASAFSLTELLICFLIISLIITGVVMGYVQSNRFSEWGAMSLAAQSFAQQQVDQLREAKWDSQSGTTNTGPGSPDEFTASTNTYSATNTMVIPSTGQAFAVTNYYSVTTVFTNPPLRQIRADCVWRFGLTGQYFTNTVITQRGPD